MRRRGLMLSADVGSPTRHRDEPAPHRGRLCHRFGIAQGRSGCLAGSRRLYITVNQPQGRRHVDLWTTRVGGLCTTMIFVAAVRRGAAAAGRPAGHRSCRRTGVDGWDQRRRRRSARRLSASGSTSRSRRRSRPKPMRMLIQPQDLHDGQLGAGDVVDDDPDQAEDEEGHHDGGPPRRAAELHRLLVARRGLGREGLLAAEPGLGHGRPPLDSGAVWLTAADCVDAGDGSGTRSVTAMEPSAGGQDLPIPSRSRARAPRRITARLVAGAVFVLAGVLFAASAVTARGTDLRGGRALDTRDLVARAAQRVGRAGGPGGRAPAAGGRPGRCRRGGGRAGRRPARGAGARAAGGADPGGRSGRAGDPRRRPRAESVTIVPGTRPPTISSYTSRTSRPSSTRCGGEGHRP